MGNAPIGPGIPTTSSTYKASADNSSSRRAHQAAYLLFRCVTETEPLLQGPSANSEHIPASSLQHWAGHRPGTSATRRAHSNGRLDTHLRLGMLPVALGAPSAAAGCRAGHWLSAGWAVVVVAGSVPVPGPGLRRCPAITRSRWRARGCSRSSDAILPCCGCERGGVKGEQSALPAAFTAAAREGAGPCPGSGGEREEPHAQPSISAVAGRGSGCVGRGLPSSCQSAPWRGGASPGGGAVPPALSISGAPADNHCLS